MVRNHDTEFMYSRLIITFAGLLLFLTTLFFNVSTPEQQKPRPAASSYNRWSPGNSCTHLECSEKRSANAEIKNTETLVGLVDLDPVTMENISMPEQVINIPLNTGNSVAALLRSGRHLASDGKSWQWKGQLVDHPNSNITITRWKNQVYATVYAGAKGTYELRQNSAEEIEVYQLHMAQMPACELHDTDESSDQITDNQIAPERDADGGGDTCYIDVVIGYNDQARVVLGGATGVPTDNAAIEAKILTAVADANTAYSNSGIDITMRLAWLGAIDYVYPASENFTRALDEVDDVDDGNADILTDKKATYGADFACLWLESSVAGGLANLLPTQTTSFFANSIVRAQNPTLTFVHEIGHNMGCRHLRSSYTGTPNSRDPYSFAHSFTGSDSNVYTTIMASTSNTSSVGGTRILYFSNPNVNYLSTETGITNSEDCARTIKNARAIYENFDNSPAKTSTIAQSAATSFILSQNFGFVGETYQIWRTSDLNTPSANWTQLGSATSNHDGTAQYTDTPLGLDASFYEWRQ